MKTKHIVKSSITASLLAIGSACFAQTAPTVRIGVLTDMSGPYSGMGGQGSVVAARMAAEDCMKAECKGLRVEILSADHQNKADIGASKARQWVDQDKVEAIADLTNSSVALAVQRLVRDKGAVALYSGPATTVLTNAECSANGFHWMFDTYSQSVGPAAALTKQGLKSWYFLTVDYAFGHSLEKEGGDVVRRNGGAVAGAVRHPLNTADMSSFLVQASASKAQVVALASSGQDAVTAIKQAREFGMGQGNQKIVALNLFLTDIHALGVDVAQGLIFTDGFYWDFDDATRAFAARFEAAHRGNRPTMVQAGVYSSVYHYLKARAAANTNNWRAVTQKMRELPIKDPIMRNASIRADGRVLHDMYLYQVKTPAESKGPWDYLKLLATIPADQAFKAPSAECALNSK